MNKSAIEMKNRLVYMLFIACHDVYDYDIRKELSEQENRIVDELDKRYYEFDKDSSVQLQMLIYLNANVYRRDSVMKRVIKAFIYNNTSYPEYFFIPSDSYVKKVVA